MNSYGSNERFWAMFELTLTWHNCDNSQLFMESGANNNQLGLSGGPGDWYLTIIEPSPTWLNLNFG